MMVHLVWVTKYRYPVLKGDVQKRFRELLIQICDAKDVRILKGVVSKEHVHMHIEYPARLAVSDLVKRLKERSSRILQDEYPELKKRTGVGILGNRVWGLVHGKYHR
jgi:putative transposase